MNNEELKEIAYTDRAGLDLVISWDSEELYQILLRANRLPDQQLHELLEGVGVHFEAGAIREDYLGALDEADSKEKIYSLLERFGV